MTDYTQVEDLEALLVLNEINYKKEVAIKELKNKRFDYYLPKYKLFIEFDGAQHHYPVDYFNGIDGYIKRVNDDAEKTIWCKNNGFKFIRLNHLMSIDMMWEILQHVIETELYINESNVTLPYIDEWCELNLNQRDLYIKKLFDDYNKYLNDILGNGYKINDIEPFEIYIANYNDQIEYKGIIKTNIGYTKYYVNNNIDNANKQLNNSYQAFMEYLKNNTQLLTLDKIPKTLLVTMFNDFVNRQNGYEIKTRQFTNNILKYMEENGYIEDKTNKRIRPESIKLFIKKENNNQFNLKLTPRLEELFNINSPSLVFIKK